MSKLQVVEEIHRAARRNFDRRHVTLKGIDDLWQADLIDVQPFHRHNNGYKYILVIIDAFSKFAWTTPLKTKSKIDVTSAFEIILKRGRCPRNLQTDMGKEFYNVMFKKLMEEYKINHYSTFSVKKASIVERLIKTLKNKLYKQFSLNGNYKWSKNILNAVVSDYNNTKHRTIRLKPVDVSRKNEKLVYENIKLTLKSNNIKNDNKLVLGDHVRISKYKGCFAKGYTPNWSTEIFIVRRVNNTKPTTYLLKDKRGQNIQGCFYGKELLKTNCSNIYLIEKVIKKKGNKLFVKWLGLNSDENCWIDKNKLVI